MVPERIRVVMDERIIADTTRALRVLETGGAPVYYVPRDDVRLQYLAAGEHHTVCEWKGEATYFDYNSEGRSVPEIGWSYESPKIEFESIRDSIAFYGGRVDEAWVGEERATAEPGQFYGGWITSKIVGPFKGEG
jgi:uncharacterized protein (DUF427 family)